MDERPVGGRSLVSVTLYVEGAGRGPARSQARQAFRTFFQKAELGGALPRVTLCGNRNDAFDKFSTALESGDTAAMLLVDAEGRVTATEPWEHLRQTDTWNRPQGSTGNDCHLMVQVIESWFLADREVLAKYYGQGFQQNSLPGSPRAIEDIPKDDVLSGLHSASRNTTKGAYNKGDHSFNILEMIDPSKVAEASPYARRLLDSLRES